MAFHLSSSVYRSYVVFGTGYPDVMTQPGQIVEGAPDIHMVGTD